MAFSVIENIYHWSICSGEENTQTQNCLDLFVMFTQIQLFTQWRKCNRGVWLVLFNFYSLEVMVKIMSPLKKISRTHTWRGHETKIRAPQGHHSYFYSCILKTVRGYFCMKNKLPCSKQLNEMCLKLYFAGYYTAPGWIVYQSLCLSKTSCNLNYNGISNEFFWLRGEKNGLNIGENSSACEALVYKFIKGGSLVRGENTTNTMPKYLIL